MKCYYMALRSRSGYGLVTANFNTPPATRTVPPFPPHETNCETQATACLG